MQSCMIIYIIMNCTSPRWYYPDRVPRVGTLCSSQPINGSPSAHLSMQFSDPNISNNVQKVKWLLITFLRKWRILSRQSGLPCFPLSGLSNGMANLFQYRFDGCFVVHQIIFCIIVAENGACFDIICGVFIVFVHFLPLCKGRVVFH